MSDDEMNQIRRYVSMFRKMQNITPTFGYKPEGSCFAMGEFNNLLYAQLIPTVDGDGGWNELNDKEIREGVLEQIAKDSARLQFNS